MNQQTTKRLAVSAFRDGVTFIVDVDELDEQGNETGKRQTIEGVRADTEEQAIDLIIAQIKQQLN